MTPTLGGGGAERVIVNILKFLDRSKIDPEYLALNLVGPYVDLLPKDIKITNLKAKKVKYSIFKLVKYINKNRPDVIMSTMGNLNLAILFIKPLLNKNTKIIIRQSNTLSKLFNNYSYNKKIIYKIMYKALYQNADKIIVQSEGMKKDLMNSFPELKNKIVRIYNPIDIEEIDGELEEGKKIDYDNDRAADIIKIISVGRLTYQKGLDNLLKAFHQLTKNKPNVQLMILGEGPLCEELKNMTRELNIEDKVVFKGFVRNPYMYIKKSDIFVLSSRYEGFPNVLLEALVCGTKIISTDCESGPREILGESHYGKLVKVNDINELSVALLEIINDNAIIFPGRQRALDFDAKKIVKEYENTILSRM